MQTTIKSPKIDQALIDKALGALPDIIKASFSAFELSMIKKYYSTKGPKALSKVLKRSRSQIILRAKRMGLSCVRY